MAAKTAEFWEGVDKATDPAAYKPDRNTAVAVAHLQNREERYFVLKEPDQKVYVRLSEEDYSLWWQMNGRNRVKDLLFYSLKRFNSLPIGHLNNIVHELKQGGFLQEQPVNLYQQAARQLEARAPESRGRRLLQGFLHTEIGKSGLDPPFSTLYRWTRPLFSRLAQFLLFLLAISGGILFALLYFRQTFSLISSGLTGFITLIAANLLVIGLHELAHALATKHVGRELDRGGFLLYWGLPAFFVDTRDTWMSSSRKRILVSWAGPYSGLILGGLVGWLLTAVVLSAPTAAGTIWVTFIYQVGFLAYLSVIINLNPLLELDGYFILMDWLEMPGLRDRSFRFWRQSLWQKVKTARSPHQFWHSLRINERIFTFFGALAFIYSLFALWLALNFWRSRIVPFAQYLWTQGLWGQVLLFLLTSVILIPVGYYLLHFFWHRLQKGLDWLAHRDLLARPEVLLLLIGIPILVGMPLIWLLLARLPAADFWHALFVWLGYLLVAAACAGVANQLAGSRFQWTFWTLTAVPLSLAAAWQAGFGTVWYELALLAAATAILAAGLVAWFTMDPDWLEQQDKVAMAAVLIIGGLIFALQLQIGATGTAAVGGRQLLTFIINYTTLFGLTLFVPVVLNFLRSRFALPWAFLTIAMVLVPWLRILPQLQLPLLALWLLTLTLYLLIGALSQFSRYEMDALTALAFSERERLINGFDHFLEALFLGYEVVFGGRKLGPIQAEIRGFGALDRDMSILQIAEKARQVLLLVVDRLDDLAGTTFTHQAGQAAYDSLPWLEAETLGRHVLSHIQWGADLAQGFIQARDRRTEFIRQADIFAGLDQEGVTEVTSVLVEETVGPGTTLTQAGHEATHFFLIEAGEVGIFHQGTQLASLEPGGYFGLNALAGQGPYNFTYQATAETRLLKLNKNDFDPLLRADTTLANQVSSGAKERALLRRMPLFSNLSPQELTAVDARLTRRRFKAGETIVTQGEPRSHLFIVAVGAVDLFISEDGVDKIVGKLGPGEHFGEYALFTNSPYRNSYRALIDSELLLLDEAKFDDLVANCERMTHYVEQLGSSRLLVTQRHTAVPS